MSHPRVQKQHIGSVEIEAKSYYRDWKLLKSVGARVKVRGEERRRSWVCLWLCTRRVKVEADRIELVNQYFTKYEGTPILISSAHQEGQCVNASDCRAQLSGGGTTFPGGGGNPGTIDDLLPAHGVISQASVTIGWQSRSFLTAAGSHPG